MVIKLLEKWINEYINGINIDEIEWVKLDAKGLDKFFDENYLDKKEWSYVYDKNAKTLFPTPIGMHYINFSSPTNETSHTFLIGVAKNNIGKKTILCALTYIENYFIFTDQKEAITYMSTVEVNSYFQNMGLFNKICNEVIKYINPGHFIVVSKESSPIKDIRLPTE